MLYKTKGDPLAWWNLTILTCRADSFLQHLSNPWAPAKAPTRGKEETSWNPDLGPPRRHETQRGPMLNEERFYEAPNARGDHDRGNIADAGRNGRAGTARRRLPSQKGCPTRNSYEDGHPIGDCDSRMQHGRRPKNNEARIPRKFRNIGRRNSPQNVKRVRRGASAEEPDIVSKHVGHVTAILQRIPVRLAVTFIAEGALWALGVISGLSWLLLSFLWECTTVLHSYCCKWLKVSRAWLVKKVPFLRTVRDHKTTLPKTGAEAVQRLLACKDLDPYSILGLSLSASDEDIKRSYKSQAVLVHPDKNHSPKAEEAFKILANAFETLGSEENRTAFDSTFVESPEPKDFLEELMKKVQESQNLMGCQSCSKTHNRYPTGRSPYEARYCASCRAKHPAKEGDLWAETTMLGFRWHFYAYLDGAIYDVTEWVRCQKDLLGYMEPNTHRAPCRLNIPRGHAFTLTRLLEEFFGRV